MDLTNRQRSVSSKGPGEGVAVPLVIGGDRKIREPNDQPANGNLKLHVDYVNEQNTRADDPDLIAIASQIPGFFDDTKTLNARLSWTSSDEQLELAFWGKNLTDQDVVGGVGGFAADVLGTAMTSLSAPRTVGVEARYDF